MSGRHLHIVFNRPPSGVSDAELNEWALGHFREVLELPGWISARRFRLNPAHGFALEDGYVPPVQGIDAFHYMSLYELEGDGTAAMSALAEGTESGRFNFPSWFRRAEDEGCFLAWNGAPIEASRV